MKVTVGTFLAKGSNFIQNNEWNFPVVCFFRNFVRNFLSLAIKAAAHNNKKTYSATSCLMFSRFLTSALFIVAISCSFSFVHGACNISRVLEFANSDWNCAVPDCSSYELLVFCFFCLFCCFCLFLIIFVILCFFVCFEG